MATSRLDRVFEEVRSLTPAEQQELGEMLKKLLEESPSLEEVSRRLAERGLIAEKRNSLSVEEFESYTPVSVRGRPVSQTLIEERR